MTDVKNIQATALVALVLGAVAIGFSPIFARMADVGPTASAFWRVALAVPFLWVLWRRFEHSAPKWTGREKTGLVLLGVFFALDLAFWHWSINYTTVANATLFSNLTPLVVGVGGILFFREQLSGRFWLAFLVAIAGSALLAGASLDVGGDRPLGDALGVVTALFYGAYILTVSRLRGRMGTWLVLLASSVGSALLLLVAALYSGEAILPEGAYGWAVLFGLALICQVAGQGLIIYALAHLKAAFSALTLFIQPIVAAVVAAFLFAEVMTLTEILGAVVILAGIALARSEQIRD